MTFFLVQLLLFKQQGKKSVITCSWVWTFCVHTFFPPHINSNKRVNTSDVMGPNTSLDNLNDRNLSSVFLIRCAFKAVSFFVFFCSFFSHALCIDHAYCINQFVFIAFPSHVRTTCTSPPSPSYHPPSSHKDGKTINACISRSCSTTLNVIL